MPSTYSQQAASLISLCSLGILTLKTDIKPAMHNQMSDFQFASHWFSLQSYVRPCLFFIIPVDPGRLPFFIFPFVW